MWVQTPVAYLHPIAVHLYTHYVPTNPNIIFFQRNLTNWPFIKMLKSMQFPIYLLTHIDSCVILMHAIANEMAQCVVYSVCFLQRFCFYFFSSLAVVCVIDCTLAHRSVKVHFFQRFRLSLYLTILLKLLLDYSIDDIFSCCCFCFSPLHVYQSNHICWAFAHTHKMWFGWCNDTKI